MQKHLLLVLLISLLFNACSKMQIQKTDTTRLQNLKTEPIAVVAFYNYTQTPMAGYSAAAIAQALLQNHGYHSRGIELQPVEELTTQNRHTSCKTYKRELKNRGYRYLMCGEVTEWRYKTGIDAEPVVGLVLKIIDLHNDKIRYSATGSQSGPLQSSIAQTAQTLLDRLLP